MASQGKTIICLLRNDLRFADNEVLLWGHRNADHVLPLYCLDPRHNMGTHTFNLPKTGVHRLKFLLETVADLRKTLQSHGSNLIIGNDKPEVVVPQLIDKIGKNNVAGLVYQKEVTKEETEVEKVLKELPGLQVTEIWGSTLFHKDDLPFKTSQTPDVYSQFRKLVENKTCVRPVIDTPNQLKPLPNGITDQGNIPGFEYFGITKPVDDSRSAFPFAGGENAALIRLHYYLWGSDKVSTYIDTRNGMIGEDFSTKFSPWLANGSLSPRTIYWEIKKYEKERTSNKSTYWVIFELLWRDYFKFVALRYGDKLFYKSGLRGKYVDWKQDLVLFEKWKDGKTGVPYIDANMRELAATGFMSNRGRQNVASFLTKDLKLDWRLGAEWFESQLLDHDVCSNYGNWLYSAGIGNDPRQDRKFNVIKQGTDYDPEGDYIRLWIPELNKVKGRNAHVVWTLNKAVLSNADVEIPGTYPMPVVTAPEWSKYITQGNPTCTGKRLNHPGSRRPNSNAGGRQERGIDYYFSTQH